MSDVFWSSGRLLCGRGAKYSVRATRGSASAQEVSPRPHTSPRMGGRGRKTSMRVVETMRARNCTLKEIQDHLKTLNYSPSRIWQLTTSCRRDKRAAPAATSPTSSGGRGRETSLDVVRDLIETGIPIESMRAELRRRGFKNGRIYQLMHHRSVLSAYGVQVDDRRAPPKNQQY